MTRNIKTIGATRSGLLTRRAMVGVAAAAPFAVRLAIAAERITFDEMWSDDGAEFSDRVKALAGQTVEMRGYMAPPLKPRIDWFVLTGTPTATCPFCDNEAAWPDDIVLIMLARPVVALAYNKLIGVSGMLDIGTQTDQKTGFVSRVRLLDAKYAKI
jgi:hypothetical protein